MMVDVPTGPVGIWARRSATPNDAWTSGRPLEVLGLRSASSMVIASAPLVPACAQSGSTDPTAPITPPPPATTAVADGCDGGVTEPPPASAESITRSEGDFDGDGRVDVVEVYRYGGEWSARTTLDGGYTAEVSLGNGAIAYALGGFDLDGLSL